MCGIAGIFNVSGPPVRFGDIDRMTSALAHRGPDDRGTVVFDLGKGTASADSLGRVSEGDAAFGFRRLSIIDLSPKGHQPMTNREGSVWMVFNGEIYNYVELRRELEDLGHSFASTSDSEVALKSFIAWGPGCFSRFNGAWAIAFLDLSDGRLILSRDRFGKKPLYYHAGSGAFVFASEIKALFRHPSVPRAMNRRKVDNYAARHYRYVDNDEESFFEGIYSVPKSSYMVIERDGRRAVSSYWTLTPASLDGVDEPELVERFRDLLTDAVRIRLRSDVPVGLLLSGGLDSGSIAVLAAAQNANVTVVSGVTGDGSAYDESEYINEVIRVTGLASRVVRPRPAPLVETLREMLSYHDEPVCTSTWYSLYLMAQEVAEQGIKVVLTGHGGDELVAGYWDHYHYNFYDLRRATGCDSAERAAWMSVHGRDPGEYDREKVRIEASVSDRRTEAAALTRYADTLGPETRAALNEPLAVSPIAGELSRRLYLELMNETVPASLRAEDRNTMAHSVENRVPFLYYRLAEFSFGLCNHFKIRNGLGKWVLREAMRGLLPEKVRMRCDKTGHNVPAEAWFRGELKTLLDQTISENRPLNRTIYDAAALRRRFDEHQRGANHAMFFWQYLNLALWQELMLS